MLEDSMPVRWSLRGVIRDTRLFRVYSPVYAGESILVHYVNKLPQSTPKLLTITCTFVIFPPGKSMIQMAAPTESSRCFSLK